AWSTIQPMPCSTRLSPRMWLLSDRGQSLCAELSVELWRRHASRRGTIDMQPLSGLPALGDGTEFCVIRAEHGCSTLTCHPGVGGPQVALRQTSRVVRGL